MSGNTNTATWYQPAVVAIPAIEFAIFKIGGVNFGLPISKIYRIIDSEHPHTSLNLAEDIKDWDLHDQIFQIDCVNPVSKIIVSDDNQKLVSIPVDTVPLLIDIPIDRIRLITEDLRLLSPLKMVSHIAIFFDGTEELNVFVLEVPNI